MLSPKTEKSDGSTSHMKILQNACNKRLFGVRPYLCQPLPTPLYAWRTLLLDPLVRTTNKKLQKHADGLRLIQFVLVSAGFCSV